MAKNSKLSQEGLSSNEPRSCESDRQDRQHPTRRAVRTNSPQELRQRRTNSTQELRQRREPRSTRSTSKTAARDSTHDVIKIRSETNRTDIESKQMLKTCVGYFVLFELLGSVMPHVKCHSEKEMLMKLDGLFSRASCKMSLEKEMLKKLDGLLRLYSLSYHFVAFAALKIAEEKFLSLSKSRILLLKLQLLHERALHRGHLKLAQQACDELGVLASPVNGVDMELKTEASLRHARTLLAANQFSEAAAIAHSLFCMTYKYNLQVENATILLLLAEIHKQSGHAVLGLPYALASLSFCQSFNLDLLKASATLTLAELWLSLGSNHAKRALSLIHGPLPMILGHGGLDLCARAYIAEAKCYLSDPTFSVFEDSGVVLDPLRQASAELQVLESHELAAEAFYLMAIVFTSWDSQKKGKTLQLRSRNISWL
ncbi:Anaphase-promoting complex subunit 5 [Morella rubra]|uniref:Anaphase-promoting complex subunit 5 n=1 Tax=Morella rubra TaxID=262757 RepID=A0A6A1WSR8_9ROSI|nr:Anaphase-promoting complex subunit 5 [Morella rubra]